ncbi:MAG: disulfide bond formation protein B [Brevundimonas sp.]|nr:MAG: disulfide bond formation protein B [Brevundimonas sp.]
MDRSSRRLDPVLARWPALALAACAVMLGTAHAFETFGHLPPCAMCLTQREAYWLAGGLAALLLVAQRKAPALVRPGLWLLAALFAVELGVAVFHAGLEWKWWEMGSCGNKGVLGELLHIPRPRMKAADLMAMLDGGGHAVRCDAALWRLPNAPWGLSMAGWNAMVALALTLLSILAARRVR